MYSVHAYTYISYYSTNIYQEILRKWFPKWIVTSENSCGSNGKIKNAVPSDILVWFENLCAWIIANVSVSCKLRLLILLKFHVKPRWVSIICITGILSSADTCFLRMKLALVALGDFRFTLKRSFTRRTPANEDIIRSFSIVYIVRTVGHLLIVLQGENNDVSKFTYSYCTSTSRIYL